MLRDQSLVPLSRQHQHALALCVRIDRASKAGDLQPEAWHAEIAGIFEREISHHFEAEEKEVFPVCAAFPELRSLATELLAEHTELRAFFAQAIDRKLERASLISFAEKLSMHIRKEERELFEGLQRHATAMQLADLGDLIREHLRDVADGCDMPNESTRLRSNAEVEES
jgi:hemerythrin-like domain-containing protein